MNKDDFFSKNKAADKTRDVTLPNSDVIKIRKLSQGEVEHLSRTYAQGTAKAAEGLRYVVVHGVVTDTGERMFEDGDISKMADIDFETIKTIAAAVNDFSGLKDPNASAASDA